MAGFDFSRYQLHLASARERQSSLGLAFPVFNPSSHPRGYGGKFMQSGQSGAGVQQVQQKVGAKVDGKYGPKTKAAVEAYQKAHGLQVDGVVGSQTAAALLGQGKMAPGALTPAQRRALGIASASKTRTSTTRARTTKPKAPNKAATTPAALAKLQKEAAS